jgi:putative aldouronate transport system substrate-binding protein
MRGNKINVKALNTITCLSLAVLIFTSGCKYRDNKNNDMITTKATEIKLILSYYDSAPEENNSVLQELERITKAKFRIDWIPAISYNDKLNVVLASNDLPDALLIPDPKMTVYVNASRQGVFWDIGSFLKDYSNLSSIDQELLKKVSTDGKIFMLPRERQLKRNMIIYRADWAKGLGLKAPDTLENIYDMAKAFANSDLDKNGKKDTIGLALGINNGSILGLNSLVVVNGGFNGWGVKDNKIIPAFMTKEYLDTLKFLRNMYKEGLLSTDFAITKSTQLLSDIIDKEKAGMYINTNLPLEADTVVRQKQQIDSNIKRESIYDFAFFKDYKGEERVAAESGIAGGIAFLKQSVKDEAELRELLRVYDIIQSKEGQLVLNDGIEGKHYRAIDDYYMKVMDSELFKKEVQPIGQLGIGGGKYLSQVNDKLDERLMAARKSYSKDTLIMDATLPILSETYTLNKAMLDKIINEATLKFIMEQIDEASYNEAVELWKKSGGNRVMEEFNSSNLK